MVELMITLVVMGVLITIAVPSFNNFLINSQTSTLANDLTGAINLARSEAVKRALPVQICPGIDPADCAAGNWEDGWLVLVQGTAVALRTWEQPAGTANIVQTPTDNSPISFGELGQLLTPDSVFVAQINGCQADRARQLTLSPLGRVTVDRVLCS